MKEFKVIYNQKIIKEGYKWVWANNIWEAKEKIQNEEVEENDIDWQVSESVIEDILLTDTESGEELQCYRFNKT